MKQKKILIATKFFNPDITPRAFRAFELAKEFARQGHIVTVLTEKRDFNYTNIELKYNFKVKATVKNHPKEIKGTRFLVRLIRFTLNYFFLYPLIYLAKHFKSALLKEKGYDLLISIAFPYPVHFGVAMAIKKNKKLTGTWVADCGDPFLASEEHPRIKYPFYYKTIEKWFCKKPDFITIPIIEAKEAYPISCQYKLKVIPQGLDFSSIKQNYNPQKNKIITFAYAGNLSPGLRDPRSLFDVLHNLSKDFKFIIYTRNKGFMMSYKEKLDDKIEFRDYVPREELLKQLGTMDFLVNFEDGSSVTKPSKLIDYALLERPVLSIKPSDVDIKTLSEFLTGNYNGGLKINNIEAYNIKNVANQFLALLDEYKVIEC